MGTAKEVDAAKELKILAAINTQTIRDILGGNRCWAYGIVFDASTHHGESFVDMRLKICTCDKLHDVQILDILMRERYTVENTFDAIRHPLSAVIGDKWSQKLICINKDGASSMVGRVRDAVTRLEKVLPSAVY